MAALDTADQRRAALANALRRAYRIEAEITQDELAARLGGSVTQGMVSRWARGETVPDHETILAIEEACGVRHGFILELAGYVEPANTGDAIRSDPDLTDRYRRDVLGFYEFAAERSRATAADPDADDNGRRSSIV